MASWLHREEENDENRLPPLQQKSRIPVRVTCLSSDSDRSSSSEDEADKKGHLPSSVNKFQSKEPSRIPIVVDQRKTKHGAEDNLPKNVKTAWGEKPLGRDSGINLQDSQGKMDRNKTSASPSTAAKFNRKRAKESTPTVRRRVPRQLTPIEPTTKQVCKDEKEPHDETSTSETSSAARMDEITPDFECNVAPVDEGELRMGEDAHFSGSEFEDDFERHSLSSDEKTMPNIPPWMREMLKQHKIEKQKKEKLAEDEKSCPVDAIDEAMQEPADSSHDICEGAAFIPPYETPKDICTDFVADELEKIIADLSVMNADMTDDEHADAMAALLLLRDEARERDEINVVKDDATVTSSVHDTGLQPEIETENKMDEKAMSEEEFDCSSVTESSEGKRKIAELDEKARRLKAQFAEENRLAIESMNKIVEEIKQSQEREDIITNEMEEMRQRQDEIKDDLKRLDEMGQRRELEDKKWRKKMDKKKEKVARRLEKVRADRRKYQRETEDENDTTGKQDQPDKSSTESQECKRAAKGTETVKNEDISNKVLYEPHEIKEYKSVKELEKKRKELRRLERLQKKSIKREKLERREQKKIEKEKRKVARKLEKLTAKNLIVSEETPEASSCVNQPVEASNAAAKEDPEEPQKVNESKNDLDTTCDVDKKQDASPEESGYHHAEVGVSNTTAKEGSEEPQKESEIEQQLDATCDVDEIKQDVSNKKSDKYQGEQGSSCLNASPEESDYHHAEVGVSNTTAREDSEDPQKENEIEQQCDATLDIDEIKREISHKEFGQHLKEEGPSFHIQDVHSCAAKEVALGNCPLQTFEYVMEKKPASDSNIFRSEVPEVDADVGGQRSSRIEKGNGVESKSDGSVEVELEKSLSGELPRVQSNASFRSDEKQKHFFCDNQRDELEASYDVEIEWVENDDSLKGASVELYSILEDLDFQPKDNVQAISVPELPRTPADVEIINQTEVEAESDKGIESNTDVSVQEGVEEEPYSDFAKEYTKDSDYLDEERKCVVENKQLEEKVLADVEIECLEKDDTLVELLSIEEELDIEPESNSQSKGEPQERYFLPDDYAPVSSSTGCEGPFPQEEEECAKDDRVTMSHIHYDPSSDRRTLQIMDVYSSGKEDSRDSDKPNAKPMNPPGNVINIDTLVSASESIDEVLDYSENAEELVQPVRSHRGKTVMKYSKSNDDEATEYCVAEEPGDKDETGSKSEGIYSYGDDKPDLIRGSSPVTNQPSPLTRKTSGRLTPFGLQPLYRSPDPILEDMDSIVDEVEEDEPSEHGRFEMEDTSLPSTYEVPQQLENRLTENEFQFYNDAYDTSCSDIPEEIEEALSESCVSCTDEERVEKTDAVVICGEERRRSSNPDSFSIVCEDNQKVLAEQTKETETKQILSIEEPLSGDKDPFIFSQHEDLNIKTEQILMGDHETMKIERTKDSAVYDLTNALRENIEETDDRAIEPLEQSFAAKEPCPVLLTSPVSSAEEGSDGNNKPSNEPRISFHSDGSEEMYNDDEIIDHIVPLEAVAISTESESLAKKDLKTCSPSSPCDSRGYDSRVTGQHYSKEDDFINEFDDLLDEVEDALELEEKGDLTTKAATGPCSLKSPTVYYVAGEPVDKDETKSQSEGNCSYSDDKPDPIRSSNPVTRQTSPLTRKTSGRFTPFGFQPFIRSPEMTTGNPRSEDMDSIIDEVEYNEHSERGLLEMEQTALPSNYGEVPQPLEDRLTENEIKSYNDAYDTTSSDIPEEIEEALSESCVSCTDEERVENRDTVVICGEESRRSSNPDSFSIVCEESSAQSRNQKLLVEQTKQTETRPILSIEEPLSGDNDPFIFSQHEDVNIQTEQISMRDHETMKIECSKDNVVYEEKDDRAIEPMQQSVTAKEPWPIVLTSPISSAQESISGDKPSNEPRISFHSDGSEKMYNDDEIIDHILPLEAVAMSTESESLVNKGLKTCLPSSPCDSRGYDSRGTGHHYSKEDDFINEFDDLLDEVEDALELEEKCDLTTKAATGPCSLKSPTEYCVAGGPGDKDETKSQSEGSCNYSDDKPDPIRSSNPVTRQTSPLTRKTSGRFTPFGFQPFIPSPEMTTGNPRSEDMGSIIDEVEYNEHSEHGRLEMEDTSLPSNYWEVPRQLEDRLTENEIKSYNDANDTTSSDIPEEIEEALSESCFSCTDEERVENWDMVVICGEESRRSSNPDSFSIVCEESSAQSRNQKLLVEQTKQTETRPILSIKEPLSGDKDPFIFSQHEDVNIQTEQISMGDHETVEIERSKYNVVYEEKDDRAIEPMQQSFTAKEPWPILLTSPISSAEESSDGDNKPSNEPRTSVLSDGSEKMHNDDDHVLPSEAATMSTKSESLVNRDLKTCSPSSPHDSRGYDSRVTGQHYSKEDDVINEFDDLLDEVEEAKELEEKGDLTAKAAIGPSSSKSPRKAGNLPLALLEIDENEGPTSHLTTRAFCEHYGVNKGKESTETVMELNNIRDTDAPIANKNVQGESSSVERDKMVIKGITDSVETGENSNSILQPSKTEGCTLDTLNDVKCEENSDPRSAADAMNELDSWGSFSDLLPSDNTNDKKNLPSANDVYDARTKESTEQRTGPREDSRASRELLFSHEDVQQYYSVPLVVTPVRTTVVEDSKAQLPRSSSPSPSSFESIEENDLDIKSHAVPVATNKDTEPDSLYDLGSPGLGEVKDEFLSASQEIFSPQKEDKSVDFGEERKEKPRCEEPSSHINTVKESDSKKENNKTPSHREADCGGTIFPFASRRDQATEVSSKVNKPSKRDGKLLNSKQRILPGLENEKKPKPDEDEFIDDFDRFLDEVEEDIRTEESRSHISPSDRNKNTEKNGDELNAFAEDETLDESVPSLSNVGSEDSLFLCDVEVADINDDDVSEAVSKKDEDLDSYDTPEDKVHRQLQIRNSFSGVDRHMGQRSRSQYERSVAAVCEEHDNESSSFVKDRSLDESITSVTDIVSEESLMSSCDEEVAALFDGALEVTSDNNEDPDSWDALDVLVKKRFRNRNFYFEEDTLLDEVKRTKYERSIAAVVNISEYFFQQELLGALEAAIPDNNEYILGESCTNKMSAETKKDLADDDAVTQVNREERKRVALSQRSTDVVEHRGAIRKAIEELNNIHVKLTDVGEQLLGRTGTNVRRLGAQMEIDPSTVLLNSIRLLDSTLGDVVDDFKQAIQKTNEDSKFHKENIETELALLKKENAKMLEDSEKESTKLVAQISALQEELEMSQKRKETLQAELDTNKVELKRLQSWEEYKERELANLKSDFERKERKWEEADELVEKAVAERQELWDDVEYLEESLRNSRESNEHLNDRVDELKETMKELKRRRGYGHLREEVELLKGSLELCNHRETLLRCQVDTLKAETSHFRNAEQTSKSNMEILKDEKSTIIEQLEDQLAKAKMENARMVTELSQLSEKDKVLSELKEQEVRVVNQLKGQLVKLKRENSTLISEKEDQLGKVNDETSRVINRLKDEVAKLRKETSTLTKELSKTSVENEKLSRANGQTSKIMRQFEDELSRLRKEHSMLKTAELPNASQKDNRWNEIKGEIFSVVSQLESELARLQKENSTLTMELSKESEKDNQLHELKCETSRTISQLEDDLDKIRKENCTLIKELSKASGKDNQLHKLRGETSRIIRKLEDEVARLRKENSTMTTELSKASEKDNQLTVLWEQVDNLRNHNKVLKDELQEAKNRLAQDLENSRDNTCDLTQDDKRSRRSHNGKSSDIKVLKKRVRQTEKELEMLGRFVRQRGLDFGERLPKDIYQGATSTGDEMVNVRDTSNHESERERDQDNKRKIQEMEGMIEDLRQTLRRTENDLEQTKGTLSLKTERTDILEHRLEENEEILKMTNQELKQNEHNLEQTEATLRGQKKRTEELENQLRSLEDLRKAVEASVSSKENELEEAYCSISKQDEKINNLIQEIKQERFDKECFQRTIEVYECNVAREKGLSEKIRELEDQLQIMEDLRKTTLGSLMDKEQKVEQLYQSISRKEEQVDRLVLELKQERSDKQCLKRAIEVTDCREKELKKRIGQLEIQLQERDELREATIASLNKNERSLQDAHAEIDVLTQQLEREKSNKEVLRMAVDVTEYTATKEKGLTERIGQLEKQLQEVNELREKTLMSLNNKEWSLEEAHFKVNDLTRQIERERSDKEYLRKAVEVTECNAKREKRLLQRTEELENKLREMIELQETAQASLVTKEQELEEMYCGLRRKDNKIKDISQELQKEKSEKQGLRKAMEIAQQQRELLDEKENEVDKLKELLYDYEEKVESLNANLKQLRREVEIAEELLAYRQSDDGNLVVTSRLQHNRLHLVQKTTKRNTQENFREMGSLMAHVGNRLKNLIQRQREVYTAGMLLKQKDADAGRVLDRLREELNQREDDMENLRNSLQKSVDECTCMRSQLEGIQCENADLKRRLGDKDDKARTLEITIKQVEGDLQRTQNFLKEREAGLEETNGILQLKCSLLTSMEAKLCLRGNEIEELRLANKEKGLELVRVETSLREVKKELEIATSIIAKQNEQFVNLKTCALRKTRDAEEMKSCIQPTQDELKRLSTRLECAKNEKANLSREVVAATVRLENETFLADRQQKALQEQVNSGLKNLKTKTKLVWDMKMDLQEAAARISRLEDEKAEQEEYFTDFKGKVSRELDLLKRTRSAENEKESLLQLTIGSAGREMATLTRENQRFRIELLQNGVGNKSSPLPREESTLDARREKAGHRIRLLEDEIKGGVTGSRHGNMDTSKETSDKSINNLHLEKRFKARGDGTLNRPGTVAVGDHTMRDLATIGSANTVSIFLCTG